MNIGLRTLIYSSKVEIENVPVYSCDTCSVSEVFQPVKLNLTELISKLGRDPEKQQLYFDDYHEIAHLMRFAASKEYWKIPLEQLVEERVNHLLDLLILAQSVQDESWSRDIQQRLSQITSQSLFMV